jgi:hypothetical protein
VCCSIVVKEKPTVGSPFLAAFPSACIPKVTKDVSIHSFILKAIPVNYTSEFQECCEATRYVDHFTNSLKHATIDVHQLARAIPRRRSGCPGKNNVSQDKFSVIFVTFQDNSLYLTPNKLTNAKETTRFCGRASRG